MADASLHYQRQLRDKAASSLDNLRDKLNSSPAKTPNWHKSVPRSPNAYSASVDRLKELLKKYETLKNNESRGLEEENFNQSSIPQPDELAPLFNDQHTLMQHLEGQVSYYKDALKMLKQKADMVIEENNHLHDQLKSQIEDQIDNIEEIKGNSSYGKASPEVSVREIGIQAAVEPVTSQATANINEDASGGQVFGTEQSNGQMVNLQEEMLETTRKNLNFGEFDDEIAKMRDMYSSKTKHFEGLLESARDQLDEKQKQIDILQSNLWKQNGRTQNETGNEAMLCVKCAHNEAVLGNIRLGTNDKVLQRIQNENRELSDTISKQRQMLEDMRRRELEAYVQVKKSCEMAEQSQLEKHEMIVNLQQLKQELERLKEQNKNQLSNSKDELKKEKFKLQLENEEKLKSMNQKLDDTMDSLSRAEIQLERISREKIDLKAAITQIKEENGLHDSELEERMTKMRQELAEENREKTLLQQEQLRLENEIRALNSIKEKQLGWSNTELIQVKKRLAVTEKKLETCQEDCVRLTECLQNAEKQVQTEKAAKIHQEKIYQDQLKQIAINKKQNEESLELLLRETNGKYEATRQELGGLLESQMQIANGFKGECKRLAEKLETAQMNQRDQLAKVLDENHHLKIEVDELSKRNKSLNDAELTSCKNLQNMEKAVNASELQLKSCTEKTITLMNKYNTVLRERQLLCDEIEFLRSQLPGFRRSDRISISDLESTGKAM